MLRGAIIVGNINIKDIAKIAGVGVSTVSRVLNDHPDVKEATRVRVMEIIEEYNYIPNNSARNLKRNTTNSIGVLVKGRNNPFYYGVLDSIEGRIDAEGYSMILHFIEDNEDREIEAAIELIMEKKLKGLICLGGNYSNINESRLVNQKIPIVLASIDSDVGIDKNTFSTVMINNENAAYEAVSYLCKNGHENIGILTAKDDCFSVGYQRLSGYKRALEDVGIEYDENKRQLSEFTMEAGYNAMVKLLDRNADLTAVFVTADIMAIGAAKAVLSKGLRIPEDISILGFDGLDYTKYFHPSISTVSQPVKAFGEESIDILFNILKKQSKATQIMLDTELIIRESCRSL